MRFRIFLAAALAPVLGAACVRAMQAPPSGFEAADIGGIRHRAAEDGARATVWIFITHDCPICNAYIPEIIRLENGYGPKGVSVNIVYSEPGLPNQAILAHARSYDLGGRLFPDPTLRIALAFGVTTTPEAVLVDAASRVAYRGRIDDRFPTLAVQRAEPTTRDLRTAIDDVLAGRPVKHPETRPVGCVLETPAPENPSS